jgi:hypothetical protein
MTSPRQVFHALELLDLDGNDVDDLVLFFQRHEDPDGDGPLPMLPVTTVEAYLMGSES